MKTVPSPARWEINGGKSPKHAEIILYRSARTLAKVFGNLIPVQSEIPQRYMGYGATIEFCALPTSYLLARGFCAVAITLEILNTSRSLVRFYVIRSQIRGPVCHRFPSPRIVTVAGLAGAEESFRKHSPFQSVLSCTEIGCRVLPKEFTHSVHRALKQPRMCCVMH